MLLLQKIANVNIATFAYVAVVVDVVRAIVVDIVFVVVVVVDDDDSADGVASFDLDVDVDPPFPPYLACSQFLREWREIDGRRVMLPWDVWDEDDHELHFFLICPCQTLKSI